MGGGNGAAGLPQGSASQAPTLTMVAPSPISLSLHFPAPSVAVPPTAFKPAAAQARIALPAARPTTAPTARRDPPAAPTLLEPEADALPGNSAHPGLEFHSAPTEAGEDSPGRGGEERSPRWDAAFDNSRPQHDLPPAGEGRLNSTQSSWLRSSLVEGPQPVFSPEGFEFLVAGEPIATDRYMAALRAGQPGLMQSSLDAMYSSLVRSIDAGLPAEERMALAAAAARRYGTLLKTIQEDAAIPPVTRKMAERARSQFLDDDVLLEELARARQAKTRLAGLERTAHAQLSPAAAEAAQSSEGEWVVPKPVPDSERDHRDAPVRFELSLSEIARYVDEAQFRLETLSTRYHVAANAHRFSKELVGRLYTEFNGFLAALQAWIPQSQANVSRFPLVTLRAAFSSADKAHKVMQVPSTADLRLVNEPGGFLVKARFETDIDDADVLGAVKSSIESHWKGDFALHGKSYRFRTEVTIKTLGPGQVPSEGGLRLIDGKDSVSNVLGTRLTLGRSWSYDTPAHEFGHIMGLADEYTETYNARKRAAEHVQPGNIMGADHGRVEARHLKTAYLLLRRRSRELGVPAP